MRHWVTIWCRAKKEEVQTPWMNVIPMDPDFAPHNLATYGGKSNARSFFFFFLFKIQTKDVLMLL